MKLLLDQNISFRTTRFEKADHVKTLLLTDASDIEISDYAFQNDYTIITLDSDFIDLATLKDTPPKIIWLRFGNSSNLKIANKLLSNAEAIQNFAENTSCEISFLEID